MKKKIIFPFLFLFFFFKDINAQNLNGCWVGLSGGREKLTVCIKKKGNALCGYTADQELNDPTSRCKAVFKGWYDPEQRVWILMGTSFLVNSGDHILIYLRLWHEKSDPPNILRGTSESKSGAVSLFNMGGGRDRVYLKKVSSGLPADMPDCFPVIEKPKAPYTAKKAIIKPLKKEPVKKEPQRKDAAVIKKDAGKLKTPAPVTKQNKTINSLPADSSGRPVLKDTVSAVAATKPPDTIVPKEESDLVKKMNARKSTAFSHIIVDESNITLKVYDNGIVDNDTVSIFYNGRLIAGKKRISEKPLVINLQLDENVRFHEITMYAENLGTIAPNTALIVVTAGSKRYELHSSASLTENAVLTFEYKPK